MQITEQHQQLVETVIEFVRNEINPHVAEMEAQEAYPAHEVFKKLGALGLLGIKYEEEYGGLGLDFTYSLVMAEALGEANCGGVPLSIGVQTDMCTPALSRFGSACELKARILGAIDCWRPCWLHRRERAGRGSDVASLKTHAGSEGGDWVINGTKMWITNGLQADWCCLLANTSEGQVHKNKSLIIVPMDARGITRQKILKMGMNASDTAQLFIDNVRVPRRNLVGEEERVSFIRCCSSKKSASGAPRARCVCLTA